MKKIQFCAGGSNNEGWENHDNDIDISKPLPFKDGETDFIFIEHGIEHIGQMTAVEFLKECYRILRPSGVIRLVFPDIYKVYSNPYCHTMLLKIQNNENKTRLVDALKTVMHSWGHKSFWTAETMICALASEGFFAYEEGPGKSEYPELTGIERHYKCRLLDHYNGLSVQAAMFLENIHVGIVEGVKIV